MEESAETARPRARLSTRVQNAPNIMTTVCVLSAGLVTIIGWLVMETMKLQKQVERIAYMLSRKSTEPPVPREAAPPRPQTTAATLLNAIAGGSILSMAPSEKPAPTFTQPSIEEEEDDEEDDDDDDDDDDDKQDDKTVEPPPAPAPPEKGAGVREPSEESDEKARPPRSRKKSGAS